MKITYYGYNTFLIKTEDKKIAIDPGGSLYLLKGWLKPLIPKQEWDSITHIFVTHGDPDHYWHVDRIAEKSNASIICNKSMLKKADDKWLMLGPRDRGLAFTKEIPKLNTLIPDETIQVDGIGITGIKTTHGPLTVKFGAFSKNLSPGKNERVGWGSIGFEISVDNQVIVNLVPC
jgi:L-ascorbate metabolism protein UlaG (beta-lactamase superfamily)